MNGRRLAALAVGASCVLFAMGAAAGPPVQVNVYLPNYGGQPQQQGAPPASSGQQAAASANLTLQAQIAIAQLAAYQRYLQYVALTTSQGAPGAGGGGDPSQYFTNGATATDVPTTGQPGAAYFNDGAEATRVPGPRSARQPPPPPPESSPQPQPPPPPPPVAQPPVPLAPYWWVEGTTPAAPPRDTAAPAPASAPPPPPPAPDTASDRPAPAMSFEEWLTSMGADAREAIATDPSLTSAEVEAAPIAEPSAAVFDVRPRVPSALREKSRERLAARGGSGDVIVAMAGTFAAGLLLGALAMRRPRVRLPE